MLAERTFANTISGMTWNGTDIDQATREFFIATPYRFCEPALKPKDKAKLVEKRMIELGLMHQDTNSDEMILLTTVLDELLHAQPRR